MDKLDLLLKEWGETLNHIRYYHNQMNQVSMWIIGTLIIIIGFSIKLALDGHYIISGLLFFSLFWLICYLGYIQKRNVVYYKGSIRRINIIEETLGAALSKTLLEEWKGTEKRDKPDEILEKRVGDPDTLRKIKYLFLVIGYLFIIYGFSRII